MLNTHIGPYLIIREIAQDGIGQSFEAVDQAHNKKVVLKYFRPETVTPEILPRLYAEAKTLALLHHPHIARVFGFIRRDADLYLVMEFVEGQTLENILTKQGRLQPAVALAFFHQIMAGVGFAHRLGVIHGDLKPSNILVTKLGPIKILNFAVAHILGNHAVDSQDTSLRHVSPEQMEGNPPDPRSDIYSLGMILYEAIVGKSPFDVYGTNDHRVSNAQSQFIPVPPSLIVADLPKWLDEFLLRMLAPSPSARFQSVTAMARVLEVEVAHPTKGASSDYRLWRQHWAGYLASSKNLVLGTGNRCLDSIKTPVSAGAKFLFGPAHVLANLRKAWAEFAFMTLDRMVHWMSSTSNYFFQNPKPPRASFKKRVSGRVKADWRRYVQAASLLVLIAVESFYFHGANISLLIDGRLVSRPSLNDSVDAMFGRINQDASQIDRRESSKKGVESVVERRDPNRQFLEKPAIPAPVTVRSEPSRRVPDVRPDASPSIAANSERETNVPIVHVPNVKEQNVTEPVGTARNTTPKSELNVKWEN